MSDSDILNDIFDDNDDDDNYLFGAESAPGQVDIITDLDVDDEPQPPVITVTVSDDKLSAYLTMSQSPPHPYHITVDQIYDALAQAKVEYGVMLDKIDLIITNQEYPSRELIAVGKEMVPGVDAELEYLFAVDGGGRPKDMGNYVDHYDLNLVENVTAGQVLVRKIPPQPGTDGMSVYGQPLRAPKAKDVRLPAGKGTAVSEENPNELLAQTDGFVRLDTRSFNKVVVEGVFTVNRDVDLSTGNLEIEGSIQIRGNVREGFQVKATGNIKVSGTVESAMLESGANVEILGGVIGGKNGATITAANDITVKFADNATMTAGGNIFVGDEAVTCTLHADKNITVGGRSQGSAGAIIGGTISAGYEIKAVSIGTDAGILTRLRVGDQSGLVARKQNMQLELKNGKDKLAELGTMIKSLAKRQSEREPAAEVRRQQKYALETQQAERYQRMQAMLAQAEREGLVTSATVIESLEQQLTETRTTLQRVESSIETLKQRVEAKASIADSLKNKKTLEQFQTARESMITKLTDLESQLAQRSANPWGNLPWAIRREVELIQDQLKTIKTQLAALEAEDATDQRISDALEQLGAQQSNAQHEMAALQAELDALNHELEQSTQKIPRIIVSDKLWAGTEVGIGNRRRRFTRDRTGVKLQLSENDAIIVLNLV
ncbi:MAG: hypothetical protein FOGNACKC_04431 [Anaerolineae bacterium]|nr:hypothetical protein [Anaerolineae bacterium]